MNIDQGFDNIVWDMSADLFLPILDLIWSTLQISWLMDLWIPGLVFQTDNFEAENICVLINVSERMILHLQPSFRSYIGRALTFKSEGCEFEPHRGRELYQKNRVIFLIIEEQLSMLKFFRLCKMVTFLMSPLSKRKYGKIFPYLLFQKGRTGKAKDPLPYWNTSWRGWTAKKVGR